MTTIESHCNAGIPILTNQNDEEFGEEIVALFIAHANALRQARGLAELGVGALAPPWVPGMILFEAYGRPAERGSH